MAHYHPDLKVETIVAGKFRRYHKLPLWQQLVHFRTIGFPNLVDFVKTIVGTVESIYKLLRWRPDVVFTKGGFVCLPVGVAANVLNIPLAIHESDAHSGLTNRILSRWAKVIATGSPIENYKFPKAKTHYIGIPIEANLRPLTDRERTKRKEKLGFEPSKPLVVVTGGGLGAQRINDAVMANINGLLSLSSLLLVSGAGQYDELKEHAKAYPTQAFQLISYVEGLTDILAAADVVVSRAGATTLLELAALGKPTVLIPNARLTGGHQLKNAEVYEKKRAVVLLDEDRLAADAHLLVNAVDSVLTDTQEQKRLAEAIHLFAKPHAAKEMAHLILGVCTKRR